VSVCRCAFHGAYIIPQQRAVKAKGFIKKL